MTQKFICTVLLDIPYHNGWSYLSDNFINSGTLVAVNVINRKVCAVVLDCEKYDDKKHSLALTKLKSINSTSSICLNDKWLHMMKFMASYYHEGVGEVALFSLPPYIKHNIAIQDYDKINSLSNYKNAQNKKNIQINKDIYISNVVLNNEQQKIVDTISNQDCFNVNLVHGITGSGKTEVYLNIIANVLQVNDTAQILLLIPEINLTPQIISIIQAKFNLPVVILNSQLANKQRAHNWYLAHSGMARIIIGTRLALMASIPNLKLIIVDEEHDLSYKQQEGIRYNARDIAIFRASQHNIPIILGSATPSLESYLNAKNSKYKLFTLNTRATNANLPKVHLIDMHSIIKQQKVSCIADIAIKKMHITLEKQQQVLIFLNRRGFAPALFCADCSHVFKCENCSSNLVFHSTYNTLHCHHCNFKLAKPNKCPKCQQENLAPVGFGTQRLEKDLNDNFSNYRLARIDSDSTSNKGQLEKMLTQINNKEIDIIVGTQMLAKGHDFKHLGMVLILEADGMLYSSNIRAKEQLFAQLMQVIGRAGRHIAGSVYIQTLFSKDLLFKHLQQHDFNGYADKMLSERESIDYFPYSFEACINAGHRNKQFALRELQHFYKYISEINKTLNLQCEIYPPTDHSMLRHSGIERANLFIQNSSRNNLHNLLNYAVEYLRKLKSSWYIDLLP